MDLVTYAVLNKKIDAIGNIPDEKITAAVNTYLDENPPVTGATAEQAAQIDKNVADIHELKDDLNGLRSEFESGSAGGGSGVSKAMAQTLDAVVRAWAYESPSFATSQEYADFKNAWGIDGSDTPVNPPEDDISASFSGGVLTISGVPTITNKSFTNGILSLS